MESLYKFASICLGFETSIQNNSLCIRHNDPDVNRQLDPAHHNLLPISPVDYQDQYPPPFNNFSGTAKGLYSFFATKGKDWEYEKERRIIWPYGEINKNIVIFDKSALKEVIVGSKVDGKFAEQVFSIIKKDYLAEGHFVEVFESSLDEQRYKLNINKIN